MALGIVNDKEFERELKRSTPDSIPSPIEIEIEMEIRDKKVGKEKGDNDVPNSLRKVIGEEHIINGRESGQLLAKTFGLNPRATDAYSNGSTSTRTYNKQPNLDHLNRARLRISGKAQAKLTKALHHIDSEKLRASSAVELANVANAMSKIVRDMEPETPRDGGQGNSGPTFIFYAPTIKAEEKYEVINARE